MKCIFSVDVEDWFHILGVPSAPPITEWDSLPSRVEKSLVKLLDIFGENDVHVTCFVLGWIAQKFPHLVKEAKRRGHEVASHGYSHKLVYEMSAQEFFQDAVKSKRLLEDITGQPVLGYRSSGFSVTQDTPWFFEKLIEAGYRYDSSVFPGPRVHGGLTTDRYAPYYMANGHSGLIEFPITVTNVFGRPTCFFGGGYLRLFPYFLIKRMSSKVLGEGRPVVFYVHPRETDPNHPRLPMSLRRRFLSYVNLATTEAKVRQLVREFELTTFERFIAENPGLFQN